MAVKTIICPECGAEQAIFREEDGGMHCAFCAASITDLPPYDEAEKLENLDDDAPKALNTVGQGINATYTLSREEVETTLIQAGKLKVRVWMPVIETVLLGLLTVGQIISIVCGYLGVQDFTAPTVGTYLLLAVFIALIPAVWILPKNTNKRIVERATSGYELSVTIYENLADIFIQEQNENWQIYFDQDFFHFQEKEEIQILELKNGQLLAIPLRAYASPEDASAARERLEAAEELYRQAHPQAEEKKK